MLNWLAVYRRSWLTGDLLAGVTTAAVVIPQAMAYATLAGLPVQYGLYVAVVPALAYALLGTSRALSVSTTSTIAILTAGAIGVVIDRAQAATTLAFLVGCLLLAAGVVKAGFLADFISLPILSGFKLGTGLVIASSQLGKVLGVDVKGDDFFQKVASALRQLGDANGPTVALAAATIALLLVLRAWSPRFPGALVALGLGILAVKALNLDQHGVAVSPSVPSGLPGFSGPDFALTGQLIAPAAGIALMCFVESISAGRAFVRADDPRLDADGELRALGGANLLGGLFGAFPAGGGLSQTAVNAGGGARSPLAGAVTGIASVIVLLFLTGLFDGLADATLGAVVLVAILGLLDTSAIKRISRVRGRDAGLALVAVAGVLLLGVLKGVLVAVAVSLAALIYGVNRLPIRILGRDRATGRFEDVERHPEAETFPGVLIVKPEGGLYFANARRVAERLAALGEHARVLLVDASAIPDFEITAVDALTDLDDRLRRRDVELRLAALNERPLEMLQRAGAAKAFEGRLFHSLEEAVASPAPSALETMS